MSEEDQLPSTSDDSFEEFLDEMMDKEMRERGEGENPQNYDLPAREGDENNEENPDGRPQYLYHPPSPPNAREVVTIELLKRLEYQDEQREKDWRAAGCSFAPLELDSTDQQNIDRLAYALVRPNAFATVTDEMMDVQEQIKEILHSFLREISPSARKSFYDLADKTNCGRLRVEECRRRVREMMQRTDYEDATEAERKYRELLLSTDPYNTEDKQLRADRLALEREARRGLRPDGQNGKRFGRMREEENLKAAKGMDAMQRRQTRMAGAAEQFIEVEKRLPYSSYVSPEDLEDLLLPIDSSADAEQRLLPAEGDDSWNPEEEEEEDSDDDDDDELEDEEEMERRLEKCELPSDPLTDFLTEMRAGPSNPSCSRLFNGILKEEKGREVLQSIANSPIPWRPPDRASVYTFEEDSRLSISPKSKYERSRTSSLFAFDIGVTEGADSREQALRDAIARREKKLAAEKKAAEEAEYDPLAEDLAAIEAEGYTGVEDDFGELDMLDEDPVDPSPSAQSPIPPAAPPPAPSESREESVDVVTVEDEEDEVAVVDDDQREQPLEVVVVDEPEEVDVLTVDNAEEEAVVVDDEEIDVVDDERREETVQGVLLEARDELVEGPFDDAASTSSSSSSSAASSAAASPAHAAVNAVEDEAPATVEDNTTPKDALHIDDVPSPSTAVSSPSPAVASTSAAAVSIVDPHNDAPSTSALCYTSATSSSAAAVEVALSAAAAAVVENAVQKARRKKKKSPNPLAPLKIKVRQISEEDHLLAAYNLLDFAQGSSSASSESGTVSASVSPTPRCSFSKQPSPLTRSSTISPPIKPVSTSPSTIPPIVSPTGQSGTSRVASDLSYGRKRELSYTPSQPSPLIAKTSVFTAPSPVPTVASTAATEAAVAAKPAAPKKRRGRARVSKTQPSVSPPVEIQKGEVDYSIHLSLMDYTAPADSEAGQRIRRLMEKANQGSGKEDFELVMFEKKRHDQLFCALNTWPKEKFPIQGLFPHGHLSRDQVIEFLGTGPIEPQVLVGEQTMEKLEELWTTKCASKTETRKIAERRASEEAIETQPPPSPLPSTSFAPAVEPEPTPMPIDTSYFFPCEPSTSYASIIPVQTETMSLSILEDALLLEATETQFDDGDATPPMLLSPTPKKTRKRKKARLVPKKRKAVKRKAKDDEEIVEGEPEMKQRRGRKPKVVEDQEEPIFELSMETDEPRNDDVESMAEEDDADDDVAGPSATKEDEIESASPVPSTSYVSIIPEQTEKMLSPVLEEMSTEGQTRKEDEVIQLSEGEDEPFEADDVEIVEIKASNHVLSYSGMEDDKSNVQSTGRVISIIMGAVPVETLSVTPAGSTITDEFEAPDPNHLAYLLPARELDNLPDDDKDNKDLIAARVEMERGGLEEEDGAIVGGKRGHRHINRQSRIPESSYKLFIYLHKGRYDDDLLPSQRLLRYFADIIQNKITSEQKETDPQAWSYEFYKMVRSELITSALYKPLPGTFERDLLQLKPSKQFEEWRNGKECTAQLLEEAVRGETTPFKSLIDSALNLKDSFSIVRARTVFKKLTDDLSTAFDDLAQRDEDENEEFLSLKKETMDCVKAVFVFSFYVISHSIGINNRSRDALRPYELIRIQSYVLEGWTGWQERGGNFALFLAACEKREKEGGYVPMGRAAAEKMRDRIESRVASICQPLQEMESEGEERAVVFMMNQLKDSDILLPSMRSFKDNDNQGRSHLCGHTLGTKANCVLQFKSEEELVAHKNVIHLRRVRENPAATKCNKCARYFLMESSLVLHKLVHHHDYDEEEEEEGENGSDGPGDGGDEGEEGEELSDRKTIKKLSNKLRTLFRKAVTEWDPSMVTAVKQEEPESPQRSAQTMEE